MGRRDRADALSIVYALQATDRPELRTSLWLSLLSIVLLHVAVAATGMYVRARRELLASLRERAERAEAAQHEHAERVRLSERARIAREMHDVLAHRISLLSMHAGSLEFAPGASQEEIARAAGVIRTNAHAALEDLREVIGVLRSAPGDEPLERPLPTLADVPELVEEARAAGMTVRSALDAGRRPGDRRAQRLPDRAGRVDQRPQARTRQPPWTYRSRAGPAKGSRSSCATRSPSDAATATSGRRRRAHRPRRARRAGRRPARARHHARGRVPALGMAAVDSLIRVLIVDDDPLVRAALSVMLASAEDIAVVGEAADGEQAERAVGEHAPHVVLMDIRMPHVDGLLATERIRARPDAPHVIVLTTFDADDHVLRALRAGASGFLLKDTPPPEILRAIRLSSPESRCSPPPSPAG